MLGSRLHVAGRRYRSVNLSSQKQIREAMRYRTVTDTRIHYTTPAVSSGSLIEAVNSKKDLYMNNQPIYSTEVDQASSQFSPIPKRLASVNQQGDLIPAALVSGAPVEIQTRTAQIYRPAKPATQSGDWYGHHWRMDWDILSKGHRWENPLMGWQSSADFMQGTHMTFKTKEDAIKFAEKQGYEYIVHEPKTRKITPKAYANNFLWSDKKLKHIRTK